MLQEVSRVSKSLPLISISLLVLVGVAVPSTATATTVSLSGVGLTSGTPDYDAITAVLGNAALPFPLIAFDLAPLTFDPTAVAVVDDGSNDNEGVFAGMELDAVGGLSLSGDPLFASEVFQFRPGGRETPTLPLVMLLEAQINDPSYVNRTASDGARGDGGFLFGTADDAIGAPDAIGSVDLDLGAVPPTVTLVDEAFHLSLGSRGIVSLLFLEALDRNANIGGTPFDLVLYEPGSIPESGLILLSDAPITVPAPSPLYLLAFGFLLNALFPRPRLQSWSRPGRANGRRRY